MVSEISMAIRNFFHNSTAALISFIISLIILSLPPSLSLSSTRLLSLNALALLSRPLLITFSSVLHLQSHYFAALSLSFVRYHNASNVSNIIGGILFTMFHSVTFLPADSNEISGTIQLWAANWEKTNIN